MSVHEAMDSKWKFKHDDAYLKIIPENKPDSETGWIDEVITWVKSLHV